MTKYFNVYILLAAFAFLFTSCVDNVIDEPPAKEIPQIETNSTVKDLLDVWVSGKNTLVTEDIVLDAIVVADDETGNFYKSIVLEDETGGITVRIEANNIYALLPVGRRVFVKAKGLYIGDYNGLIQLGFGDDDGDLLTIPISLVGDEEESLIIPAERNQEVTPKVFTINTLGNTALSTLIKLEGVEFASSELGQTYADAVNQQTENRTLEDCDGNSIVVRTSGFSAFAGQELPSGNGDLIAVYTIFGSTKQLTLRSPEDLDLNGERCGEVVVDVPEPNGTIADLLSIYSEGSVNAVTNDLIFDGVVTANDISGNFYKQIVIEDENDAINIQIDDFDLFETFYLGRRVVVKAQDLAVGDFNGLPQLGLNDGDKVSRLPSSLYTSVVLPAENEGQKTPTKVTVDELLNGDFYNKLIQLDEVEFAESSLGSTFADAANMFAVNHDIVNCDEEAIILRTSGFADFAGVEVPGGNGSLTAIFSVYQGTKQLLVRKIQDASMSGERCDGEGGNPTVLESLSEDFESVGSGSDVSLTGWTNSAEKGVRLWRGKEFGGNTYVQATAYQDDEPEMETWLITPKIKMNGNNVLSFRSAIAYHVHDGLSIQISTDFDGNVANATWTELSADLANSSNENYDWVESGNIDLSSYSGEVVIGFKYEGKSGSQTTTFQIDDIEITK